MTSRFLGVASALMLFAGWCCAADDASSKDAALQGAWRMVAGESDGNAIPADVLKQALTLTFSDKGVVFVKATGAPTREGTYKLDATKDPKQILIKVAPDPDLDAIYKIEGDSLSICGPYTPLGNRPTEFKSDKGSEQLIMKLERVK